MSRTFATFEMTRLRGVKSHILLFQGEDLGLRRASVSLVMSYLLIPQKPRWSCHHRRPFYHNWTQGNDKTNERSTQPTVCPWRISWSCRCSPTRKRQCAFQRLCKFWSNGLNDLRPACPNLLRFWGHQRTPSRVQTVPVGSATIHPNNPKCRLSIRQTKDVPSRRPARYAKSPMAL